MDKYTIGEIYRLGLLKNHLGEPYKDKATVSKVVSGLRSEDKKTAWGMAKVVTQKEIDKHNNKYN